MTYNDFALLVIVFIKRVSFHQCSSFLILTLEPLFTFYFRLFRIRNKDKDLYKKLVAKASRELTEKQVNNLRPEIKEDVLIKFNLRMEKLKWLVSEVTGVLKLAGFSYILGHFTF